MRAHALTVLALIAGASGCAAVLGIEDGAPREDAGPDTSAPSDASADASPSDSASDAAGDADAGPVACASNKPFGAPTRLTSLETTTAETNPYLTGNELAIFFSSNRAGTLGSNDLYTATRLKRTDPFGPATSLGAPPNAVSTELDPRLSTDELTLRFSSDRFGNGIVRMYQSNRASKMAAWSAPVLLTIGMPSSSDEQPFVTPDEKTIYFTSNRLGTTGAFDLWTAPAASLGFGPPTVVAGLESPKDEMAPVLSFDELEIFFGSNRNSTFRDIFHATRATKTDPWSAPTAVTELDTTEDEIPGWLSRDSCRLYFASNHGGTTLVDIDLWVAERTP